MIGIDATHLCVSCTFVRNSTIIPEPLGQVLMIETSYRGHLEAHHVYKDCRVNSSGREFYVDLILLDFFTFHIILGIDWLENYRVIDYEDKIVTLCSPKRKSS